MSLQSGQQIAHYRLVEKLGEGGMGVVWRARDTRLDRDVALKTLPSGIVDDPARRERFIREAKAAAAVSHPNIAAIHDVGESEGVVYLAMELVEGRTLRALAAGRPLPVDRALSVAAQVAEGLARAHREGIVHRDIKPDNVIVDETGHAKILDFGLARLRGAREEEQAVHPEEQETRDALTQSGQTVGTVPYMSPEQARGKPTDGRSDLFSLGIVLYELVTGRLPFKGETAADTMSAILKDAPPSPSSLNLEVTDRLSELLDKCLQKDPARRYQSAGDLAIDLRRLAEGPSSSFVQPVIREEAPKGTNRLVIAGAVAVIAIAILAAVLWPGGSGKDAGQGGGTTAGTEQAASAPHQIRSLAVLPLEDHSPGDDEQYFADGMTEALIAEIAQLSDLRVISRTSVMQYRENRPPIPEIARQLGVDAVVEGSILKAEGRIRIIAQLIEASADQHLWAGTYERDHEKVLTLQREVAVDIAKEIHAAIRPGATQASAEARPVKPEAHVLLLKGRQDLDLGTEEAIRRGMDRFRKALEIDPGYARAWVGVADAYVQMANAYLPPREAMPKAKEAVLRALALDPEMADAYTTLGGIQNMFEWNDEAVRRSMERAAKINPNLPQVAMDQANLKAEAGEMEEALALVEKARSLDPLSAGTDMEAMWFFLGNRRYGDGLKIAEELVERFPASPMSHIGHAVTLVFVKREGEAVAAARKATDIDESVATLAVLSWAQGRAGREEEARETLARLERIDTARYYCPYETALSWASIGEYGKAEDLFERGIEERAVCWSAKGEEPRTDELQEFKWFRDLAARATPMTPDDPDYVPIPPELGLSEGGF